MSNYQGDNLQELYCLVKKNDEVAFQKLYDNTWISLYDNAFNRIKDQTISKEIIQDLYIDLWNKRHEREINDVAKYLAQAVRYKVIDYYRKRKFIIEELDESLGLFRNSELADRQILEQELEDLLYTCIDQLPKKRREIFLRRFLEGLSTKEISELFNISQKTVQNQLLTSENQIRSILKKIIYLFF